MLDGRMRCELDAHQYRLTDKLHALVYPQPEDYEKLEPYYNEIIASVEYFTDSTVGELKKRFDALETADFSADAIEGAKASRKLVVEYKTFHVSEGRKNLLKGTLDLYEGYVINEFDHGECADLLCLGDFILGLPIAKTKSNTFVIENKKP